MAYHVYMLTNRDRRVLYAGVTNNLPARIYQHREGMGGAFTSKYKVNKLVYHEEFADITEAIRRERQLKGGSRARKVALIDAFNPGWLDLYPDIIG